MIAETAIACATVIVLYAMRIHEARVALAREHALALRMATGDRVTALEHEQAALRARLETESGRISGLALRR